MSYPSKTEFDNLRNSLPLTYQTRGNYAFRTDLASNINTALRNVNTALAFYAKKTDIPIIPANVATKTDLASYALASDLGKYQPAGRYVSPSELEAYQPKGDYASIKDLVSYAKSSDLVNFQPKGEYALTADLDSYAKESSLSNFQPKGDYAVKTELDNFQPKGDYAVKSSLFSYALKSDLANFAVKTDLASYQPKGDYAVKTDLSSYQPKGDYAVKTDLAAYQPKGNYALQTDLASYQPKGDYAVKTELAAYARPAVANEFLGTQTFKAGIILAANSQSDLLGAVKIPNATSISATNLTAGTITSTTMNLGTLNVSNISAASIAGYQTAGNYALQTDFTTLRNSLPLTYQTAGNYALAADVQKLQQQNIFSMRAAFNGGLNVTSDATNPSKFTGPVDFTGSLSANNLFLEGTTDPSLRLGPDIKNTVGANARLNVQDKAGTYMRFFQGATESGSITHDGTTSLNVGKVNSTNLSTGNASITNLSVGNFNISGATTFNAQATFEKNTIVKTSASSPFQVTGPGGLRVTGGNLTVSGDTSIDGNSNVGNQQIRGIFPAPATSSQGLHFQWNRSGIDGESWIINNQGGGGADSGIRFGKSNAQNVVTEFGRFNNSGAFSVEGSSTFKGASTFKAQSTFEKNATVTTTANNPFQVAGDGGLKIAAGGLVVGGEGGAYVSGNASITGSLSANHVFLESGGDPSLRLGPNIKGTGNARLNVQDKAGTYMRFFQGANQTGSITHDGGTSLNVGKVKTGVITMDSATISGSGGEQNGRLHISGNEFLYLLNKDGVIIGKEWGGNGNLSVQGNSTVNGSSTVNGGLRIGNWVIYQHSNGNLHFRNNAKTTDFNDWDLVLDGGQRKKLYTNTIDTGDTNDLILQNRNRDETREDHKVTQFKLGGNGVIYQDFNQWGNKKKGWLVHV